MNLLLGHDAIEKNLLELYNSGRMPHAIVFTGPKGIGKATLAYRFARFLLKHGLKDTSQSGMFGDAPETTSMDISPQEPAFRRVASGAHPDFFTTEKKFDEAKDAYKDTLDVEEIRKIAPFLRMTSSEGGWRIVLCDDADSMNRNAQNALLKILEEPPKNALLILIAHRAGALIPTIRSRARFINFSPLPDAIMKDLLVRANPAMSAQDMNALINLSGGSFGKALQYSHDNAVETLNNLTRLMESAPSWRWLDLHKLADQLSGPGSDPAYKTFQELLLWMMRESARSRARGTPLPVQLRDLLKNSSLEQLLKICENLEDHFGRADGANLDRRQTVLGAFSLIS
jgi:DNA polymerase-3 subunit delta'